MTLARIPPQYKLFKATDVSVLFFDRVIEVNMIQKISCSGAAAGDTVGVIGAELLYDGCKRVIVEQVTTSLLQLLTVPAVAVG